MHKTEKMLKEKSGLSLGVHLESTIEEIHSTASSIK